MINNKEKQKGFALIEMIVSVGIFAVVMTIGAGALLNLINVNKRSQTFKIVVNNLNLAMESMSRDLRVGYDYNCGSLSGGDCPTGDNIIYFKSRTGRDMIYRLNSLNNSIEKSVAGSDFVSITAGDIVINNLKFYVIGSPAGDAKQPKVIIIVEGNAGNRTFDSMEFGLQTMISQRLIQS